MTKREFTRIIVRLVGILMIASGLQPFVAIVLTALQYSLGFRMNLQLVLMGFLSIAIGMHLLFQGAWVANKLLQREPAEPADKQ